MEDGEKDNNIYRKAYFPLSLSLVSAFGSVVGCTHGLSSSGDLVSHLILFFLSLLWLLSFA